MQKDIKARLHTHPRNENMGGREKYVICHPVLYPDSWTNILKNTDEERKRLIA